MQLYAVKDLRDGAEIIVSLEQAKQITKLNEAKIEWALEEYGISATNEHMIHEDLDRSK